MVLYRDLEVAEVMFFEQRGLVQRRFDERLGGGLAILLQQPLVQRTGVDTDAQRNSGGRRRAGDLADLVVERLDVSGIHPDRGAPGIDGGEHILRLEMD